MVPEGFACDPLEAVALYGKTKMFFAHNQAETCVWCAGLYGKHQDFPVGNLVPGLPEYTLEIFRAKQAMAFAETGTAHECGNVPSGGELGATLGTTALEYKTATTACHTGTKTVSTSALQYAGLESTFHNDIRVVIQCLLEQSS